MAPLPVGSGLHTLTADGVVPSAGHGPTGAPSGVVPSEDHGPTGAPFEEEGCDENLYYYDYGGRARRNRR